MDSFFGATFGGGHQQTVVGDGHAGEDAFGHKCVDNLLSANALQVDGELVEERLVGESELGFAGGYQSSGQTGSLVGADSVDLAQAFVAHEREVDCGAERHHALVGADV